MIESTRQIRGKTSVEQRYSLSSIQEPARIAAAIGEHWCIGNQQHWVLDVQFGEVPIAPEKITARPVWASYAARR